MLRAFTGSKPHDVLEAITEYDASYGDSAWDMLPRLRNVPDAARTPHIPIVFTKGDPDDKATGGGSVKHGIPSGPGGCIRRRLPTKIAPGGEEFVIARRRRAHSFRPVAIYLSRYGVDS